MILQKFTLAAIVAVAFTLTAMTASADVVVFDFRTNGGAGGALNADLTGGGTDFDPSGAGDTITVPNELMTGFLTATVIDVTAPEYVIPAGETIPVLTGNTLSSAAGDGVVTNVSGQDSLGIQNPSISNDDFDLIGAGSESSDINVGESFTFSFDQAVVFTEIELESVVPTDGFEVLVDGTSVLALVGEDAFIPLGGLAGLTIDAGSAITFSANAGEVLTSSFRIETFTVDTVAVVPEPSSLLALVGMAGLFAVRRRR